MENRYGAMDISLGTSATLGMVMIQQMSSLSPFTHHGTQHNLMTGIPSNAKIRQEQLPLTWQLWPQLLQRWRRPMQQKLLN